MTTAYLVAFIVGGIAVLASLLLTELDIGGAGHGVELHAGGGGHATSDGVPFLSITSLSAALLGAGAGGLIGTWAGLGPLTSGGIALASGVALLVLIQGVLLPYLRRQQANSHQGRISYIGLLGTVTLDVPTDGWGEVAFVDADGNRVRSRAVTAEPHTLAKATRVYISDVDADVVHVVSVPEDHSLPERP